MRTIGASAMDWLRAGLAAADAPPGGRLTRRSGAGRLSDQLGRESLESLPQIGR